MWSFLFRVMLLPEFPKDQPSLTSSGNRWRMWNSTEAIQITISVFNIHFLIRVRSDRILSSYCIKTSADITNISPFASSVWSTEWPRALPVLISYSTIGMDKYSGIRPRLFRIRGNWSLFPPLIRLGGRRQAGLAWAGSHILKNICLSPRLLGSIYPPPRLSICFEISEHTIWFQ